MSEPIFNHERLDVYRLSIDYVVWPLARRRLNLKDLLRDCQPAQLHGETDFGPDVGREVIE